MLLVKWKISNLARNVVMKSSTSLVLSLAYCLLGSSLQSPPASAQITPDGTTSTTVNVNGNNFEINNGERLGSNLFHSFRDFSVPNGGSAFFNNAADIVNIFSRVTGGNISNIDGLIRANGSSNLFLLNPAGIIFSEGARLDIGGSFYGSTADSILFPDGEFSATDLDNPPLLTINGPIGLNLGNNPGEITIIGDGLGTRTTTNNNLIDTEDALRVNSTSTLGLVGGDLNLEGATLKTDGGRIELGSVAGNEQISFTPIDKGFSLGYEGVKNFGDIQLSQTATIDASGLVSGDIQVQGNNITLTEGSTINASTLGNILTQETPGIIQINAIDTITIDGEQSDGIPSSVSSLVNSGAVGNAGGVTITTNNLNLTNGGEVNVSTLGQGNAGSVEITARDTITIDGERSNGFPSGAISQVRPGAVGSVEGVTITTGNLNLTKGGRVSASTFGEGNAGSINITARDRITIDGDTLEGFPPSGATSFVNRGAIGDAGDVTITTGSLTLTNGGRVSASTVGEGNAGSVNITARDTITFDGQDSRGFASGATSQVNPRAIGDAGGVSITTGNLNLTNGGRVSVSTLGQGIAGLVNITARDRITIDGQTSFGFASGVISLVNPGAIGDAEGVTINTGSLTVTNGGLISASTFGEGNAGSVNIIARDTITIDGEGSNGLPSGATSFVSSDAVGNAGNITITAGSFLLTDGAIVSASTEGEGKAGNIAITANTLEATRGSQIQTNTTTDFNAADITLKIRDNLFLSGTDSGLFAQTEGAGDAGNIIINSPQLTIDQGASIFAFTEAMGDGGTITVNAPQAVLLTDNSKLTVETRSAGKPGDITITTGNLTIGKDAEISATATKTSTNTEGGGSITVNAANLDLTGKLGIFAETQGEAPAGTLNIQPDNNKPELDIQFTDTAIISASTTGSGTGGDINLTAPETINITGQGKVAVETTGIGNAGSINITTQNFNISNQTEISASTFSSGQAGNINITANNFNLREGATVITNTASSGRAGDIQLQIRDNLNLVNSSIAASTAKNSTGRGGNINIDPEKVTLTNSQIAVNSQGSGTGGNIDLQAGSLTLANQSAITAETFSTDGGNIEIALGGNLIFRDKSEITASAGTDEAGGDGGNIDIDAEFILSFPDNNKIIAEAFLGTGGNINITTNSIFGREFLEISASSQLGLEGTVSINTLELELSPGLVELPSGLETLSIPQGCEASRGRGSSFISTGRGGLPPSPTETLSSGEVWKDVQLPTQLSKNSANTLKQSNTTAERIVEATSWIINEEGIVELVAEESSDTHQGSCR